MGRDRFETDNAQTPGKTDHHPGPENKASQQNRQPYEICKTSIPGSNPGGASNLSGVPSGHMGDSSFRRHDRAASVHRGLHRDRSRAGVVGGLARGAANRQSRIGD